MNVLGKHDEAQRQHELTELGDAAAAPGPLRALSEARDLVQVQNGFDAATAALEERVATTDPGDSKLPYLRTLVVLTKHVELHLRDQLASLQRLYEGLEEMHDLVHETFPAE